MRVIASVIFLITIILINCTQTSDQAVFEKLKSSDFGKTLLKSIQLKINSNVGHPVDSVLVLLKQVKSQLEAEELSAKSAYETKMTECTTQITNFANDITNNEDTISKNSIEIKSSEKEKKTEEDNLSTNNKLKTGKEDQLQSIRDIRKTENNEYIAELAELGELVKTLKEGKIILERLLVSNTNTNQFLERNNIIKTTNNDDLKNMLNLIEKKNVKQNPYLKMAEMAIKFFNKNTADQEILRRVLNIIDQLIAKLSNSIVDKNKIENERQDIFEREETLLISDLTKLNADISEIQGKINNLSAKIIELNEQNNDLTNKNNNLKTQKKLKEEECNLYEDNYQSNKIRRNSELEIIEKVIIIFETRFDSIDEYIKDLKF